MFSTIKNITKQTFIIIYTKNDREDFYAHSNVYPPLLDSRATNAGRNLGFSRFLEHPLTIAAAFFGLPHKQLNEDEPQSLINLAKNFIGWEDNVTRNRKILNSFLILPTSAFNAIATAVRCYINTITLLTEFLPETIRRISKHYFKDMWRNTLLGFNNDEGILSLAFRIFAISIFFSLWLASEVASTIGHSITSPIATIRGYWREGKKGLAVLSGILSALSFTLLFPLFLPNVLSTLNVIPGLSRAVVSGLATISPIFYPIGQYFAVPAAQIAVIIASIVGSLFNLPIAAIAIPGVFAATLMPAIAGLGFVAATLTAGLGPKLSNVWARFRHEWHEQGQVNPTQVDSNASTSQNPMVGSTATLQQTLQATPGIANNGLTQQSRLLTASQPPTTSRTAPMESNANTTTPTAPPAEETRSFHP